MRSKEFIEEAKDFIEWQLSVWPEAAARYDALGKVERLPFRVGRLRGAVQFNPARAVSTMADVTEKGVSARPCFLCAANRPQVQEAIPITAGWSMLLNPFPIFPFHFTIASDSHTPQLPDVGAMVAMAEKMPSMAVFFNGASAGASAPDHLHMQAVSVAELPLLREVEESVDGSHSVLMNIEAGDGCSVEAWPFAFRTAVIRPDRAGSHVLSDMLKPVDNKLINIYVWIGEGGELRILEIPRKAHRPPLYTDPSSPLLVSPGAIDMAGVLIAVRREDFLRAPGLAADIYGGVALR